jgi:hypothetical protein
MKPMRIITLLLFLASAFAGNAQIKIDKQKGIDLTRYETFMIEKGQVISLLNKKNINESNVYQVMQTTIAQELKLKGYQLFDDSVAQLVISYVLEEADRSNLERTDPKSQVPDQTNINEVYKSSDIVSRTLIIDVADRKANSLWTANCTLRPSQGDVYNVIEATIIAAFKKFPKRGKKK